jgi:hypothetical protein
MKTAALKTWPATLRLLIVLLVSAVVLGVTVEQALGAAIEDDRMDNFGTDSISSAGTSTSTTTLRSRETLPSRMKFGFFNFTSAAMDQTNQRAARVEGYNYFSADYKVARNRTFSIRPVFTFGTKGTNYKDEYKENSFSLGDAFLNYQMSHLFADYNHNLDFKINWRLYAPTSDDSQRYGTITRFRPAFEFKGSMRNIGFNKVSIVSSFEPDYYVQGRTAALDDKGEKVLSNRWYGYQGDVGLQYDFNRDVAIAGSIGHEQYWSYTSQANALNETFRAEKGTIDLGVSWAVGPAFLVVGVSQSRDLARPRGDFSFFNDNESEYYLLNSWRL